MNRKKLIIRGLYGLFLVFFLLGAIKLVTYYLGEHQNKSKAEKLATDVIVWRDDTVSSSNFVEVTEEEMEHAPVEIKFDELMEQNEDTVAWIYCDDTTINYPIVQAADNDFYLRRGFDKESNRGGSIFMDANNNPGFTDRNTIIYGHNMKSGNMFHDLTKYKDEAFYKDHPSMYFYTPWHTYRLEIIAATVLDGTDNIYNLDKTVKEVDADIERIRRQSAFATDVVLSDDDRLITLSTCSYETDDARFVVIGRLSEW